MASASSTMAMITMKVEFDGEIRRLVVDSGTRVVLWLSSSLSIPPSQLEVFEHPSMQLDSIVCPTIRVGDLFHVIEYLQIPNTSLPRLYARRIQPQWSLSHIHTRAMKLTRLCIHRTDSCVGSSSITLYLKHASESMRQMLVRAVEMISNLPALLAESGLETICQDQNPSNSDREHRDKIHHEISSLHGRFRDIYEKIESLLHEFGDISSRIERENQLQKNCVRHPEILQFDETKLVSQRVSDADDGHKLRAGYPFLEREVSVEGGWDQQAGNGKDLQASESSSEAASEEHGNLISNVGPTL